MKTPFFLLSFLTVLSFSCINNKQERNLIIPEIVNNNIPYSPIGNYKSMPAQQLFMPAIGLNLNADSTFAYALTTCLGIDSSYGRWSCVGNLIYLRTANELIKSSADNDISERVDYVDVSNQRFEMKNGFLIKIAIEQDCDSLIKTVL